MEWRDVREGAQVACQCAGMQAAVLHRLRYCTPSAWQSMQRCTHTSVFQPVMLFLPTFLAAFSGSSSAAAGAASPAPAGSCLPPPPSPSLFFFLASLLVGTTQPSGEGHRATVPGDAAVHALSLLAIESDGGNLWS